MNKFISILVMTVMYFFNTTNVLSFNDEQKDLIISKNRELYLQHKFDQHKSNIKFRKSSSRSRIMPSSALWNKEKRFVEWEVIIKFKDWSVSLKSQAGINKLSSFVVNYNLEKKKNLAWTNTVLMRVKWKETVERAIARLENNDDIEYVQPNFIYYPQAIDTNDTYKDLLWGLENYWQTVNWYYSTWNPWSSWSDIDWVRAMEVYKWGSWTDVITAIIDDWIDPFHPDLIDNFWDWTDCLDEDWAYLWWCIYWYSFKNNNNYPVTIESHWTHIAWTIAWWANNWTGVVWVNPNAKIMILQVNLITEQLVKAIKFAANNWAKVINASWWAQSYPGQYSDDKYLYEAIKNYPWLFISASGNCWFDADDWWVDDGSHYNDDCKSKDHSSFPNHFAKDTSVWEALDNIIWVTATDQNDDLASFANYWNEAVHVWAPWVNIYSSVGVDIRTITALNEDFNSITLPNLPDGYSASWTWSEWRTEDSLSGTWGNVLVANSNYNPYTSNVNSVLKSKTIDLSGLDYTWDDWSVIVDVWMEFYSQCDTEISSEWNDYLVLEFSPDWENFTEVSRFDEIKNQGGYSYEDNSYWSTSSFHIIPLTWSDLTSSFKFQFRWITNDSDNNYVWCFIDKIFIWKVDHVSNQYGYMNWTSMAAPHVAWLASLIMSYDPSLSIQKVKDLIVNYWDNIASLSDKIISWKRINAFNSLSVMANPSVTEIRIYNNSWKTIQYSSTWYINQIPSYFEWDAPEQQWSISWYIINFDYWDLYVIKDLSYTGVYLDFANGITQLHDWPFTFSVNWKNHVWKTWDTVLPVSYMVDTTSPSVPVLNFPINQFFSTGSIFFDFDLSTDNLSWIKEYILNIVNNWNIIYTWSSQFSTNIELDLEDWEYDCFVRAVDNAWNISWFSNTWNFTIDTIAPDEPTNITLQNWEMINLSNQNNISLSWSWTVYETWTTVHYYIQDYTTSVEIKWSWYLSDNWSFNFTWIDLSSLPDWNVYIDVYLADPAWNFSVWRSTAKKESVSPTWTISINTWASITNSTWLYLNLGSSEYPVTYTLSWSDLLWDYNWTLTKSWAILVAVNSWDWEKNIYVQYKDGWENISPWYSDSILLDQTAWTWTIIANISNDNWSKAIIFSLSGWSSDINSSSMKWTNNLDSSTWSWNTYTVSEWTIWTLVAKLNYEDISWNVAEVYSSSYKLDNTIPEWSITQTDNWIDFVWTFSDLHSWIDNTSISWFYSLDWTWTWIWVTGTSTWLTLAKSVWFSKNTYIKALVKDIVWNEAEIISEKFIIKSVPEFHEWISIDFDNLHEKIKNISISDTWSSLTWAIWWFKDTIESIINVDLSDSWTSTVSINITWATINKPKIIEILNKETWLYEIAELLSDDKLASISINTWTIIVVKSLDSIWSTTLTWILSNTPITPSSTWVITNSNNFIMTWVWWKINFWSWVKIESWFNWIILPPTEFTPPSWSKLNVSWAPGKMISVWANWQTINFTWWAVTLSIDLWSTCFDDSSVVKYWDWDLWQDYNSTIENKVCNWNELSFDVKHFSIYWWDWWVAPSCVAAQVTCSASCWNWTYTINTWEECSWWLEWQSCNLWSCPSSWGWWGWGWWGSSIETIWNLYVLSTSKRAINTIDNISLNRLKDWIFPVDVTMNHTSEKYRVKISSWTRVTNSSWSVFIWRINALERLSDSSIAEWKDWLVVFRPIKIASEKGETVYFSKPVEITVSTKWVSSKINKPDILFYIFNEQKQSYGFTAMGWLIDEENDNITFTAEKSWIYVLWVWAKEAAKFNIQSVKSAQVIEKLSIWSQNNWDFSDIGSHWSKTFVNNLLERWAIKKKDKFYPDNNINRAELIKMVIEAFWHSNISWDGNINFSDIDKNLWYSKYLSKAVYLWIIDAPKVVTQKVHFVADVYHWYSWENENLQRIFNVMWYNVDVNGVFDEKTKSALISYQKSKWFWIFWNVWSLTVSLLNNETNVKEAVNNGSNSSWRFRPWDFVNRAEAMKIILQAKKIAIDDIELWKFTDVKKWIWFEKYVNFASSKWIASWYWNWKFWPSNLLTRWQAAKIVFNTLNLK